MRIYEYEAKALFNKAGIPVPQSRMASNVDEVFRAAQELGKPVVLKPQTLIKARGEAGLIAFGNTPQEAARAAESLFGRMHQKETVQNILVEEKVDLLAELYLGIIIDYAVGRPTVIASPNGGADIEEIAAQKPELVQKVAVLPSLGLSETQAKDLSQFLTKSFALQARADTEAQLQRVIMGLYRLFTGSDCEMAEINPLALRKDGQPVALDGAMVIDDDALFHQPDLVRCRGQSEEDFRRESDYRQRGWTYLRMDGDIGILSSGAGLTMAILDLIREHGGKPANFLDTAQMDRKGIYDAFQIFSKDPTINTVFVHIFAGLNRCDELAEGIKDFLTEYSPKFHIVVRMVGNREDEGREILRSIGISAISGLEEAVIKTIEVNG